MSVPIQIFALYLGRPCQVTWPLSPKNNETGVVETVDIIDPHRQVQVNRYWWPCNKVTLILRRLSSVTEAEARAGYEELTGEKWGSRYSCLENWLGLTSADGHPFSTLGEGIGDPKTWAWLLRLGVDLFGLIESGDAIENPQTPAV